MKIEGIHHVQICIPVGSEDAARGFYCGTLGLKEIDKPHSLRSRGGLWLELGDRQLHIVIEDEVDRDATKAHVAYVVDDLGAWKLHLKELGIEVVDGVDVPGYVRAELRDPFGNRIELIQ